MKVIDFLAIWGIVKITGMILKPVIEEIAKESAKNFVSDLMKNSLKNVTGDIYEHLSTLIHKLILDWAESPGEEVYKKKIPILIELRTYINDKKSGKSESILEYIHHGSGFIYHLNKNIIDRNLKIIDKENHPWK